MRIVFACFAVAAVVSSALAQPTPNYPVPHPNPVPPPPTYNGPPGPAIPIYKSGGVVTGRNGYYTYDTGDWLLGGGAVTRQNGFFTMAYPVPQAIIVGEVYPLVPSGSHRFRKHGIFHR
ncbi:MAG: hypothetical protein RMJ56_10525 [Gemmataceae bacterium]|nr:hypothetical protein [Gemmata sp.]MDW8198024.1 hypothetical protein [Gemmataceae bacterium]